MEVSENVKFMKIPVHRLTCAAAVFFVGGLNVPGADPAATNGVVGVLTKRSALPAPPGPQAPGEKNEARAAELLRDYRGDLGFVQGKVGIGSGFIAQYKNHKYFITNAHVLAGNPGAALELLDRTPLQLQTNGALVAVGHDLIAIQVATDGGGIPTAESVDTEVSVGDDVVTFGNALAGGVINPLLGKVVGLGPRILEVTAQFEPGSSGGPIIHLRSGKVIGVATYATSRGKLSGEKTTRRFAYRLDTVAAWQRLDYQRFQYEYEVLEAVHKLTIQLAEAVQDATQQLPAPVPGTMTKRRMAFTQMVRRHEYESPLIRNAVENYLNALADGQGHNDAAAATLVNSLIQASQNNLAAATPLLTYDYFQHGDAEAPGWSPLETNGFENERRAREELMQQLVEELQRK
jgi:hypothetical protein